MIYINQVLLCQFLQMGLLMSIKMFNKLPNEIKILIHNNNKFKKSLKAFFAVLFFLYNTGILQSSK
jgi:hypothetical protein